VTPAAALLADLRARGLRLRRDGGEIVVAPRALLTSADRAHLIESKSAVLDLLRAEAEGAHAGPCGLCGGVLAWVEGWPARGAAACLCGRCAGRPLPTLAVVYAELTAEECQRLERDAAGGDVLAGQVLALVGPGPRVEDGA
jgi:hypothetical protein